MKIFQMTIVVFLKLLPFGLLQDTSPQMNILQEAVRDDGNVKKEFDFIVIGSGPSGAVLANRLTEVPEWTVLLIEAGDETNIVADPPFVAGALQFTDYNWGYKAEQEDGFCRGCFEKRMLYPHGKALGGTSIINYMIQVRGNPLDYDRWAAMGNPGWSYKEVLPYFIKSEDAHIEKADAGYHGKGGYLSVSDVPARTESSHAYVRAAQEAGYPYVDYNGKSQIGVSYVQGTLRNGRRDSAETAFLRPVRGRKNLTILTKSRVVQILIRPETKEAYGIKYVRNKRYHEAIASKEVIVCAGGIPVLRDLPVGQKMYDHATFPALMFQLNESIVIDEEKSLTDLNTYIQFLSGRGIFTSLGGVESLTYIKTNASDDPDPSYPDIELIYVGGSLNTDRGLIFRRIFNVPQETYDKIWKPFEDKYLYQIFPMLVHPRSYGYIRLKSKDPFHWPKFYANFYSDPENHDVKTFIAAIREVRRINSSPSLQRYGATMVQTLIPGCEDHVFDSDEYWECAIRTLTGTFYHQVSTCKMGPEEDPEAVVDAKLRVHGVKNLRVVDTSVIPLPPTAHTAGPSYMIGEKASDLIKQQWAPTPFNLIPKTE
ncbi:hypothetical protein NQ318_002289 [Aromia moschata]|uniref:Uncharacterized protein n=1 Tax=Aromia moschata TaxID=1265417 RepID=A0AAV8Z4A0_9CUCU|nr:hypothetical protein NQ318_002289 [Aromia moschata]